MHIICLCDRKLHHRWSIVESLKGDNRKVDISLLYIEFIRRIIWETCVILICDQVDVVSYYWFYLFVMNNLFHQDKPSLPENWVVFIGKYTRIEELIQNKKKIEHRLISTNKSEDLSNKIPIIDNIVYEI